MYVLSQSTSSLPSIQSHHPVLLHRSMLHVRPFHNLPNPPGHPAEICDGKIRPSLVRRRREIHFYHPPGMARNFGDGRIIFLPDRVCKKTSPEDDESCHDMSVMIFVVYIVFYYIVHLRKGGASCHPEKNIIKTYSLSLWPIGHRIRLSCIHVTRAASASSKACILAVVSWRSSIDNSSSWSPWQFHPTKWCQKCSDDRWYERCLMVCDVVVPRVEHLTLHSLKCLFSTGEIHKDRQWGDQVGQWEF